MEVRDETAVAGEEKEKRIFCLGQCCCCGNVQFCIIFCSHFLSAAMHHIGVLKTAENSLISFHLFRISLFQFVKI